MSIRVFVGCAPNHEDAESQAVLEYTLRSHASEDVQITWMKLSNDPSSPFHGWNSRNWPTPFSGFRWAVPALCNFEGRAIYMDSDMIVMSDIAELWNMPIAPNCAVRAKSSGRLCVSLWNCSHPDVARELDFIKNNATVHYGASVEPFPKDQNWNCLDGEDYPSIFHKDIKCLHYTSMPHQPHLPHALTRLKREGRTHWFDGKVTTHWRPEIVELFNTLLIEATRNGYSYEDYCRDPIFGDYAKGSVAALQGAVPSWGKRTV